MAAAFSVIMVALTSGCATRPYQGELMATDHPYAVGSGDRLRVIVFGQDSLSNSYSVDASGQISMPLIGLVPVNGMTTQQVQHAIEARLREEIPEIRAVESL